MSYTGTHERLYIPPVDPDDLFEKQATIGVMPDDEKKWPAHLVSEIHKQLPFVGDFDVDLTIDRQDPESGYALGYAMIRNKTASASPINEVGKDTNRVRVPLIVEDRKLQPFHTFELGGNVYPLTEERVKSAMVDPGIFDAPVDKVPRPRSLVDQLYPPYQQRQGFGRIAEPNTGGIGGIGKSASSPEEAELLELFANTGERRLKAEFAVKLSDAEDAPEYRKGGETSCDGCKYFRGDGTSSAQCAKFDFQALPDHTCNAWVAGDPKKEASFTKEARLLARPVGGYSEFDDEWMKQFEGTPLLDEALALKQAEAVDSADRARRRAAFAMERAHDATFDIKIANIEGELAKFRQAQAGTPMMSTLEKLSHCKREGKVWSDEFMGTPLHKTAMVLEVQDAERKIRRDSLEEAEEDLYRQNGRRRKEASVLELELAKWRLDNTYPEAKVAAAMLRFVRGSGVPGSMVIPNLENAPRWRQPPVPQDFWFYPLSGTPFLMGVPSAMQKQLEKENDQQKLRQILAGPMRDEMMAARSGMPAQGRFILAVKKGDKYHYVKPEFTAALASAGGGDVGVQQALQNKKASAGGRLLPFFATSVEKSAAIPAQPDPQQQQKKKPSMLRSVGRGAAVGGAALGAVGAAHGARQGVGVASKMLENKPHWIARAAKQHGMESAKRTKFVMENAPGVVKGIGGATLGARGLVRGGAAGLALGGGLAAAHHLYKKKKAREAAAAQKMAQAPGEQPDPGSVGDIATRGTPQDTPPGVLEKAMSDGAQMAQQQEAMAQQQEQEAMAQQQAGGQQGEKPAPKKKAKKKDDKKPDSQGHVNVHVNVGGDSKDKKSDTKDEKKASFDKVANMFLKEK